jgi:hypothetical protein
MRGMRRLAALSLVPLSLLPLGAVAPLMVRSVAHRLHPARAAAPARPAAVAPHSPRRVP